jgi:hypothetical protein
MTSAMTIAASGMMAAQASFFASVSNTAPSSGPVPQAPGSVGQPVTVSESLFPDGVTAALRSNGEPARAVVNQISASLAYKANIASFKAADKAFKTLLDMTA